MGKYCNYCMAEIAESEKNCPACGNKVSDNVAAHHLLPGTLLNGRFYVGKALGEGGFGITYIGKDTNLDMKVAIKEYYPNGYVNRSNTISACVNDSVTEGRKDYFIKGRERFLNEARVLAKFSGEAGIVNVRDFFEENNTAYIIMEYLDGVDLKHYLKSNGPLTGEETIKLLMPVMTSLKKVHDQNLIHRDISPDNIMLVGNKVKLLDFGAARSVSAAENKSLSVILKPGYAPEEQYRSKGEQGPWTDIYALCATMYKCVTGITPDDATQRVFSDEVKKPSALGVHVSADIENAIMKGMSINQRDRYQNIDDLIKALEGAEVEVNFKEAFFEQAERVSEDDDFSTVCLNSTTEIASENEAAQYQAEWRPENIDSTVVLADFDYSEQSKNEKPVVEKEDTFERETREIESILPEKHASFDDIIKEKENIKDEKTKGNKKLALIILAGIAAIAVVFFIGVAIFNAIPKNKIDPKVDGFIVERDKNTEWIDPKRELDADNIYSNLRYNERMFYGSYTVVSEEKDAMDNYKEAAKYSDAVYNNYGCKLSNIPYKIVAGPQNLEANPISAISGVQWMELYFCAEDGSTYPVDAAYKVKNNQLIITPVVYYEADGKNVDYELAEKSIKYDFVFSGPYLTLMYKGDTVTLVADGFEKEIADSDDLDYYYLNIDVPVSPGSKKIDDIEQIALHFDRSYNTFYLYNSNEEELYSPIGKLSYDGVFTFSYSESDDEDAESIVRQFVYFYCGYDGLVLTDGKDIYYYQGMISSDTSGKPGKTEDETTNEKAPDGIDNQDEYDNGYSQDSEEQYSEEEYYIEEEYYDEEEYNADDYNDDDYFIEEENNADMAPEAGDDGSESEAPITEEVEEDGENSEQSEDTTKLQVSYYIDPEMTAVLR